MDTLVKASQIAVAIAVAVLCMACAFSLMLWSVSGVVKKSEPTYVGRCTCEGDHATQPDAGLRKRSDKK
jgi:hypothetical protein